MGGLSIITLLACLTFSANAFYIYTPSHTPKVEIKQPTLADYISWGFSFDGKQSVQSALQYMPKITISKRAVPKSASRRRGTPIKRTNNYQILTGSTPTQTQSAAIDEDSSDFSYFSAMNFGSKGETLYMLLDTGSSDTWVMGSNCKSTACGTHNTFGDANSDTLKISTTAFSDIYGTGNVTGVLVTDNVELAGLKVPLTFGSASSVSDHFDNYPMDGLLALGRPAATTLNTNTFMQALTSAKLLPANLFGVNLQRHEDGTTDGEINFGAPDTSKFTGQLTYLTTSNDQNWEIPVDDVVVGGVPCKLTGNTAIIDTGTSQLFLPPTQAEVLFKNIPGSVQADSETFNIPCDTKTTIEMQFNGVKFAISPEDYIGAPVSGGNLCSSTIFGVQVVGETQWLLGDVFLKNVYSVFDSDKARIGFGSKTASAPSSTAAPGTTASPSGSNSPLSTSLTSPTSVPQGSTSNPSSSILPDTPVIPASKTSGSTNNQPSGTSVPKQTTPSAVSSTKSSSPGTSAPQSSDLFVLGDASRTSRSMLQIMVAIIPCIVMIMV